MGVSVREDLGEDDQREHVIDLPEADLDLTLRAVFAAVAGHEDDVTVVRRLGALVGDESSGRRETARAAVIVDERPVSARGLRPADERVDPKPLRPVAHLLRDDRSVVADRLEADPRGRRRRVGPRRRVGSFAAITWSVRASIDLGAPHRR